MADLIKLNKKSYRNTKGIKREIVKRYSVKEKQKPGFFWVDQFNDWILGINWGNRDDRRNISIGVSQVYSLPK